MNMFFVAFLLFVSSFFPCILGWRGVVNELFLA